MRDYREVVVSNPDVMMGKPVIAGTRITVELILEKLAAGETVAQILDAHPRLNEESIRAALAFAADAEEAGRDEIHRRLQQIDSGSVELIPWEDARRRLRSQLDQ